MFLYPLLFEKTVDALDERMVPVSDIQSDSYILFTAGDKNIKDIILLKASELEPFLNSVRNFKGVQALFVGMIRLIKSKKCSPDGIDVYEVVNSAANKGFGPLMYELAMSAFGQTWVISDRSSVSPDAAKVWNKFYEREDVSKKQLIQCKQFKNPALNVAYTLKSPLNLSALESHSRELLEKIAKESGFSLSNVEQTLVEYSQTFFQIKYPF